MILLLVALQAPASAQMQFVKIPAGSYTYGKFDPPYPKPGVNESVYTPRDYRCAEKLAKRDAMPGFTVTVSEFEIGRYEVTQQQWMQIMHNNPSYFKGDDLPVQNVSWYDAQQFINKMNDASGPYSYRLPTEFEWEYAARAGADHDISWDSIRTQAHISTNTPAPVGSKHPNAWGLYDMLGNVWEWTSDFYNEKLFASKKPETSGSEHVLKGASFVGDVKNATYMTHAGGPGNGWDVGFRLVREAKRINDRAENVREPAKSAPDPNGWHISRTTHQGTTPFVKFQYGVITLKQHPYGQGGVLLTNKKYRDFELTVDVKIDSFCNSGIFLRASESGQAYQVELAEPGGTGNLFGEMMSISKPGQADKSKAWKPNDWNTFRIRMTGEIPRIVLWINGQLMWDVTQPKNDFTANATEGYIGLQTHWSATYSDAAKAFDMSGSWKPGKEVKFRNIRITEL